MARNASVMVPCTAVIAGLPFTAQAQDYSEFRNTNLSAQLGSRPAFLVDQLVDGQLKEELQSCRTRVFRKNDFSIGHRGACMQFPEHTLESYVAAARQGAGILECDVTFTADQELVCRHSQCDLHTTTDIVTRPELNAKCTTPWEPGVEPTCCTSDITLAEYRTLRGKMDSSGNPATATTPEEYAYGGTADWRTDLYQSQSTGTLMTHAESAALFRTLRVGITPELKSPSVEMPFNGFSQDDYRQKLIDELRTAGIDPSRAWVQSFNIEDVRYWIANTPDFGEQAVYLEGNYNDPPDAAELESYKAEGINYYAPPTFMLVESGGADGVEFVSTQLATDAKSAGLKLIAWTLERTGPRADLNTNSPPFYWQSLGPVIADRPNEGLVLEMVDALAQDVGVEGIFSDWPATTTFYANCKRLP
ncbi:MAG: glycerophosphodiester phosphodiesterase family protein [Pseudomonadota bacterium]